MKNLQRGIQSLCWRLLAAVAALFLYASFAHAAPAKDIKDYYKKLFSLLQIQQYKYDGEIGKPTFTTIQEEEQYKKTLFKGVKITATLETKEMLDAYADSRTEDELEGEDREEMRDSLYKKYHVNGELCFSVYVDNTSGRYANLELHNLKDNVLLQFSSGKELKPVYYDKELEDFLPRKISGLVCYPERDAQGSPLLTDKVKWVKLRIVRIFPMDASYTFHEAADFEFTFETQKYFKAVKEGIAGIIPSKNETNIKTKPPAEQDAKDDPVQLGLKYVKEGKLDDAIASFKLAVEQSPDDVSLYLLLGSAYLKKDLYDAAISIFRQAVDIDPLSPLTHYHLGVAYREKKEFEKAAAELKQAVAAQEDYKEAYYLLGMTYVDLNLTDDARKMFEKVLEIDSSDERARLALDKLKK